MQEIFRSSDFVTFQFGGGNSVQSHPIELAPLNDYRVTRIAGLAVGKTFAIESKLPHHLSRDLTLNDVHDALGEWVAIAEKKISDLTEFVVLGDSSGYCPIFYGGDRQHVVIADTFLGVVHGLKQLGVSPELDIAHYLASLFPAHPHFTNPSVRRTMSSRIKILGIDEVLLIQDSGPKIINRAAAFHVENATYETLLERGSQLVRDSIVQLSKIDNLQTVLSLSGGVDSRLVLSMISSSGHVNEFQLASTDPRTWKNNNTVEVIERDIAIADKIRSVFGLEWATIGEREFLPFDFRDSLNFHQSYKSNFAHLFTAPPGHTIHGDLKITFRGGGGELLRSTLTGERIAEQIKKRTQNHTEDYGFVDWYMSKLPMLKDGRSSVKEYMAETFKAVSGESLTEKLNDHYRQTRNRTHFGHVRQSGSTNNYAFHPLSNQYFSQASQMLDFEERSGGKAVRDLFILNDPSLLNLPFENEESTYKIANPVAKNVHISNNAWQGPLDQIKAAQAKSKPRKGWARDERLISTPFDKIESSRIFTAQGMKLLEDFVAPEVKKILKHANSRVFESTETSLSDSLSLSSKVASALDVFLPSSPKGSYIRLFTTTPEHDYEESISKVRVEYPVRLQDGWNNQPVPEFSPELSIKNSTARVSVGLSKAQDFTGEFAFYFYKNNRRIGKIWYTSSTEVSFEIKGSGIYSAQVFYRANSASRETIGIKTNEALID